MFMQRVPAGGAGVPMYQARSFGRPLGPWRQRRADADDDAIAAREAHREPWGGRAYMGVGCEIVSAVAAGPTRPAWAEPRESRTALTTKMKGNRRAA